jgi:hypothetical protein
METMETMIDGLQHFITTYKIKTRIINGKNYLVLYKRVRKNFGSLWHARSIGIHDVGAYRPGTIVKCTSWNVNRSEDCGKGLHVASFGFALLYNQFVPMIEVLVKPEDVVCVPHYCGKIRCKQLRVARVVNAHEILKLLKHGQ